MQELESVNSKHKQRQNNNIVITDFLRELFGKHCVASSVLSQSISPRLQLCGGGRNI